MSKMQYHPLRRNLSDLMHERALPNLSAPLIIRNWVILVKESDREKEAVWLKKITQRQDDFDYLSIISKIETNGGQIFERHGEYSSYIKYLIPTDDASNAPNLGFETIRSYNFPWLDEAPGEVFRSYEIVVSKYAPKEKDFDGLIDLSQAVSCYVFDKKARIWSDFRMQKNGSGRMYLQDLGLKNDELSRLLQSLMEIGNYRKLALLGFPVAQPLVSWLNNADKKLSDITNQMVAESATQEAILDTLIAFSAEVEQIRNEIGFRFGATDAFYKLANDRLSSLRENRIEGFSTMSEFIDRRLRPAMRTCEAVSMRLEDLSERIGRVNDLLRSRISINLEVQNQELLKSMNFRAALQMKMSSLVEGLSVFAVSYYVFSIVKYAFEDFIHHHKNMQPVIILIIMGLVWAFINYQKRRLHKHK